MNPKETTEVNEYFLSRGKHKTPDEGRCAMEWVSYLAGESHTDHPVCVSPVLQSFAIRLNDNWDDEQRQKLRPYLARCIGTAGDGRDDERGWLATDWLIRTFTPRFLELVPSLAGHAAKLRGLSPVLAPAALDEAMILLREAREASAAAWAAARDAARDAARAAAWNAAWDAARAAARDAARAAAWDAAWDAAWNAARDAAWAAARDVAWDVAWDAARAAARDAARAAARDAARDAARAAAGEVFRVAVTDLQASALDLFDRILPTEIIQLPAVDDAAAVCGLSIA